MKKVVLDTNAYSALLKGDVLVKEVLENADEITLPVFVLAELLFGFKYGRKEAQNIQQLNTFLGLPGIEVGQTTNETAAIFADLRNELKLAGTPIPINDVWIASMAIESGGVVVTYDKHYLKVKMARVWRVLNN